MKTLARLSSAALGASLLAASASAQTFADEVAFLRQHTKVLVLTDGQGMRVAVAPDLQGRVMTSSARGESGPGYGWINRELLSSPKRDVHFNPYGGEDRFWLGPEGGQYAVFFKPGEPFDLAHWYTPPAVDTEPYSASSQKPDAVTFEKKMTLTNRAGTVFDLALHRVVRLVPRAQALRDLGLAGDENVQAVAFESENRITNTGSRPWGKESGLLSVWILGMFKPSPQTTVVVPFEPGPEAKLGEVVNSAYFGKVPAERLVVGEKAVFFSGDGRYRSKIGVSPARVRPVLGSYDASGGVLTLVQFDRPAGARDYVNSMWEVQKEPFAGDVVNSYNDGPPAPGAKPLGPFYELETSSPAAALPAGGSLVHRHRTIHLVGDRAALDAIARKALGVGLDAITSALPAARVGETPAADKRHWAYRPPVRPPLPAVAQTAWVRNPIDRFVLARLEREGLGPAPEASRETLIRRLSLDLIGLPPTLQEVDAFLADARPDAYEKVVDRLLASPHYGERWARPWLDLARYADTNGYEKDRRRSAWMYRDWLIEALNRDLSFRDFTIEQIAGDMLPGATAEQKTATGFHRNTLLNQEGGIDVEEARWETLVDRVNTTATAWLGSTVACAQCHDHKFDPFSQKDYYRMLAFFDNGDYRVEGLGEVVRDKWIVEPELELAPPDVLKKRDGLKAEAEALKQTIDTRDLAEEIAAWEKALAGRPPHWTVLRPVVARSAAGAALEKRKDGSLLVSGTRAEKDTYTVLLRAPRGINALRLEALPDPSLPARGPGLSPSGNFVLTRLRLRGGNDRVPLVRAVADYAEDGRGAAQAIDEAEDSGWSVDGRQGQAHLAMFLPGRPMNAAYASKLEVILDHGAGGHSALGRFRFSVTSSTNPWGGFRVPDEVRKVLDTPGPARSAEQTKTLGDYFRPLAPSLDTPRARLAEVRRELDAIQIPTAMVLGERAGVERPSTPMRVRGSYMSPGERVYAATPSFLPPIPAGRPANRLGFAYWLVDGDNPLTARVAVNRAWEQIFGRGLVLTSEDFGTQGDPPTHAELLDWLATTFTSQDWSLKAIHRLIVTSATYRQSSRAAPAQIERDPDNRLLARGPRFRVEAETVRDIVLAVSGLLAPKVGGPSVFPDQPDGVWDNPYSKDKWTLSEGEDRYRRSLYTFVRRTAPYPMLTTFDAPSREFCTVRRVRTNTPLQALTTLNDPAFFAAARSMAARALREAGPEPEARAVHLFRLGTARRPSETELAPLLRFYRDQAARHPGDDAMAWTMVASVVLNLDETVTKE